MVARQIGRMPGHGPRAGPRAPCRAPFWRLTVGNFTSQEEARSARARLMVALPAWGRESYVVREKVRILNYTEPHASEE